MERVVLSECSSTWKQKGRVSGTVACKQGWSVTGGSTVIWGKVKKGITILRRKRDHYFVTLQSNISVIT